VFNKAVYFTTFTPTSTSACGGGGDAKLYAVQMLTGFAALNWANHQLLGSASTHTSTRGTIIGQGIASKPSVTISDSGISVYTAVIAGTTSQQLPSNQVPPPANMRRILYWREAF
jgi:Tfp pilus tip-associated adhesin PilY1